MTKTEIQQARREVDLLDLWMWVADQRPTTEEKLYKQQVRQELLTVVRDRRIVA